jgi:hypothetical protein
MTELNCWRVSFVWNLRTAFPAVDMQTALEILQKWPGRHPGPMAKKLAGRGRKLREHWFSYCTVKVTLVE